MELGRICPIENQILKIIASSHSKETLVSTLTVLKKIVSSLLSSSSDGTFRVLKNDNSDFSNQLFTTEGVHELLIIIGYHEEKDIYIHEICDENMIVLGVSLTLLTSYLNRNEIEGSPHSPQDKKNELSLRSETSLDKLNKRQEKNPSTVKEFLEKHAKKEEHDILSSWKHQTRKSLSTDFSFNPDGYFHQSGKERQSLKKKEDRYDLFGGHSPNVRHKGSSCFFSVQRKEKTHTHL